jgi:hypothetical protein
MVERCVAVVDARFEVVVPADGEPGERDVGRGDAEVLGAATEAFDDRSAQLERERRLDACTRSASCVWMRCVRAAHCLARRWRRGRHLGGSCCVVCLSGRV